MDKQDIIKKTNDFVKDKLHGEGTGHDWYHIDRVRRNALNIGKKEGADLFIVELAALLHDIADWKFHDGDDNAGPQLTREWLSSLDVDEPTIEHVSSIVANISYKGANVANKITTLEGKVVQDADRLDALGAIGIARCFATGPKLGNPIHDPDIPVVMHDSPEAYKNHKGTSINHFYEKLFLLKDRMNTDAGKNLAQERHDFMKQFVNQFLDEWNN